MFSLIIPIYKNEASLPELLDVCRQMNEDLGRQLEVVFVVDGSPDASFAYLQSRLDALPFAAQLVLHSRNFGSFAAIRTGLARATGYHMAVMAADLQEPPDLCLTFFGMLSRDQCDVVVGSRNSRADPLLSRAASMAFWWLFRKMVQPGVPEGGVDMFGCNRAFRDALLGLPESNTSLIGQLFWLGFRRECVGYDRLARKHGKSAWTLSKKFRYLSDSLFAFSDLPLRMMMWVGAVGVLAAIILALVVIAAKIDGAIEVPGYAATLITITFFAGLNMLGLGIIGGYVWRSFENSKGRPESVSMFARSNRVRDVRDVNDLATFTDR